jgi:hypothetical protein
MQDLMARHIDLAFRGGDSTPLMQAASMRAYAVSAGAATTKPRDQLHVTASLSRPWMHGNGLRRGLPLV